MPAPVKLGAKFWYVGDRGALDSGGAPASDGENVATWTDLSRTTNATQTTDADRGNYDGTEKAIRFTSADTEGMAIGASAQYTIPATVFVVYKLTSASPGQVLFNGQGTPGGINGGFYVNTVDAATDTGNFGYCCALCANATSTAALSTNRELAIGRLQSGSVGNLVQNGTSYDAATTCTAFATSINLTGLAKNPNAASLYVDGHIYETGMIRKYLTQSELDMLERYLHDKYGLSFTP